VQFAVDILDRIDEDEHFFNNAVFSDEATFHLSGKVNRHNCRIWGSENPHEFIEHERDSPKINVWCALSHTRVIGPFFFHENTVKATNYLDMLESYAAPKLEDMQPHVFFQPDGAPPHWGLEARRFLNEKFPSRWNG
jgi:hypothetical protein